MVNALADSVARLMSDMSALVNVSILNCLRIGADVPVPAGPAPDRSYALVFEQSVWVQSHPLRVAACGEIY